MENQEETRQKIMKEEDEDRELCENCGKIERLHNQLRCTLCGSTKKNNDNYVCSYCKGVMVEYFGVCKKFKAKNYKEEKNGV